MRHAYLITIEGGDPNLVKSALEMMLRHGELDWTGADKNTAQVFRTADISVAHPAANPLIRRPPR
jgi:hypothetical protein